MFAFEHNDASLRDVMNSIITCNGAYAHMRDVMCYPYVMSPNESKGGDNMTPNQLASRLAGADHAERIGKAFVRPFLRRHYARDVSLKGSSWNLSDEQIKLITAAWKARQAGKSFDITAARKSLRARKPKVEKVETPVA